MKLRHTEPCKECPWRKDSLQGYLGGHDPEMYADAVAANEVTACHCRDFGPDDDRTSMCAGALAVAANACILPHRTEGGPEARERVGRRNDCFGHPAFFYEYHAGKPYTPFLLRKMIG